MLEISPKLHDCRVNERLEERLSPRAIHREAFARLLFRPFDASRRLFAGFDIRLAPFQLDEKSRRQSPYQ
jgi:hypothetical protein